MRPADIARYDQAEAAAATAAERALWRHRTALPGGARATLDIIPAAWFVAAIERHNAIIAAGRGRHCGHVTGTPGLRVTALWPAMAGVTLCGPCAAIPGALAGGGDREDKTCDACRAYVPAGVFLGTTRIGATLVYFATCGPCKAAMAASGRPGGARKT